jgi:hypothetical protein
MSQPRHFCRLCGEPLSDTRALFHAQCRRVDKRERLARTRAKFQAELEKALARAGRGSHSVLDAGFRPSKAPCDGARAEDE